MWYHQRVQLRQQLGYGRPHNIKLGMHTSKLVSRLFLFTRINYMRWSSLDQEPHGNKIKLYYSVTDHTTNHTTLGMPKNFPCKYEIKDKSTVLKYKKTSCYSTNKIFNTGIDITCSDLLMGPSRVATQPSAFTKIRFTSSPTPSDWLSCNKECSTSSQTHTSWYMCTQSQCLFPFHLPQQSAGPFMWHAKKAKYLLL